MIFNKGKQIKAHVPFLTDKTVIYVGGEDGTSIPDMEDFRDHISLCLEDEGVTFIYLPELASRLSPEIIRYMFPGQEETVSAEGLDRRIREIAGLDGKSGFLYRRDGQTFFREIPDKGFREAIDGVVSFLLFNENDEDFPPVSMEEAVYYEHSSGRGASRRCLDIFYPKLIEEPSFSVVGDKASFDRLEEPLSPQAQAIIEAWERLSREFGITLDDLELILSYKVKLSPLRITTAGKIFLTGFNGQEVKMDDLSKAVYFFFLRNPAGATLKEMQDHEDEIFKYYMGITGRDNVDDIRKSVHNLVEPFSNGLNVCLSRIKRAFKNVIDDHIARYYYVDGRSGQTRTVALDRDLVIWDH